MSDDTPQTPEPGMITRRTLAAGVAWAVPAVAVAGAAPAYAASVTTTTTTLPPCIGGIANTSLEWEVDGAQYSGCNCADHVDVRLKFTVSSTNCPYSSVKVRVKNYDSTKSSWCWNATSDWLTKTATLVGGVWTYPGQRLTQAGGSNEASDGLYFPAYSTGGVRDDLGSCNGDYYVGINDGMHINPCQDGPYFQYQVSYDGGTTWGSTQYWGYRADVPLPGGCVPAAPPVTPVLSLVSNTCVNNTGTNNDTRTVTVSWTGSAEDLQYATNSGFSSGLVTSTLTATERTNKTATRSFNDTNCDTVYYFRVRYTTSNPDLTSNTVTTTSGVARVASGDQLTVESSTTTAAPKVETLTTTAAPKVETLTTTAASKVETLTTTAASGS